MKKRTIITTEKHETWVIRQPADESGGDDYKYRDSEREADSLPPFLDRQPEENAPEGDEK